MDELVVWGAEYGLKFNSEKTVVAIFHRRKIQKSQMPDNLCVNGKPVPFSNTMRYLGVTLDEKLSWTPHFNQTLANCKATLMYTSNIIKKMGTKTCTSKGAIHWNY